MNVHHLSQDDAARFLEFRTQGLIDDHDAFRVTADDDAAVPVNEWRARIDRDYVVAAIGQKGEWMGVGGLSRFAGEKLRHKGLIWGMYVTPTARGTGVADEIMRALIHHAQGKLHHLQLTVMADNHRAQAFYERHGFTVYAVEPESVLSGDGFAGEALMRRPL